MGPLLLLLLIISSAKSTTEQTPKNNITNCNRLKIGDKFYDKELLWANIGRPYNLNVHKATNTLFFSYSTPESYSDVDFQLAYYNIATRDYQIVAGIRGGCTVAMDTNSDDIYMGGSEGIYKFNMLTKIADFYKEKGQNIWSLFHKRNLFYISYPDQKLHLEIDGRFSVVKEFTDFQMDHFYITVSDEIFFANQSGLFNFDTQKMKTVVLNELLTVRQFVEDNEGNFYICTNFGILINTKFDGFKKIVDYKNIFGLAFDRDNNFIISDMTSLIKLKLSKKGGCDFNDFHW